MKDYWKKIEQNYKNILSIFNHFIQNNIIKKNIEIKYYNNK